MNLISNRGSPNWFLVRLCPHLSKEDPGFFEDYDPQIAWHANEKLIFTVTPVLRHEEPDLGGRSAVSTPKILPSSGNRDNISRLLSILLGFIHKVEDNSQFILTFT